MRTVITKPYAAPAKHNRTHATRLPLALILGHKQCVRPSTIGSSNDSRLKFPHEKSIIQNYRTAQWPDQTVRFPSGSPTCFILRLLSKTRPRQSAKLLLQTDTRTQIHFIQMMRGVWDGFRMGKPHRIAKHRFSCPKIIKSAATPAAATVHRR